MTDRKEERKVKVVDRRWFTAGGELREPLPPAQEGPARAAQAEPAPETNPAPETAEPASAGAVDDAAPRERQSVNVPGQPSFLDLLDTLAQPAVAFLSGQVPGRGRDVAAARFYIDLLAVVEEKTRGRLSLEEKSVLDDVLYQLRSLYLAATR